jgi:hypothetical protein
MKPIKQSFPKIKLDEAEHKYYIKDVNYNSVSSRLNEISPVFPAQMISKIIARNAGITQQAVLDQWKYLNEIGIAIGNKTHAFGEKFDKDALPTTTRELGIKQWWKTIPDHYEIFSIENPIYNEDLQLAGTPDILFLNKKTNKIIIADYKTNGDLFTVKSKSKFIEPFSHLPYNNFMKYVIQLNYYKYILEQRNYKVETMKIIWSAFNKENFTFFTEYVIDDIQDLIKNYEKSRRVF